MTRTWDLLHRIEILKRKITLMEESKSEITPPPANLIVTGDRSAFMYATYRSNIDMHDLLIKSFQDELGMHLEKVK